MKKQVLRLTTVCAALALVGCTTMQPLKVDSARVDSARLSQSLKRGDNVELVTASGQQLQFKIDAVDDQGLQGGGQRVAFSDIQSISRKEISAGRTALVALGIVAAGALAAGGGGSGGSGY
jgi:hypothetical protein